MRTSGKVAAGLCLLLAATACSSGSGNVLVQDSQSPPISTTSASASSSPTPTSPAARATHRIAPTASSTAARTPGATPRTTPTAARTAPTPKPSKTATKASTCTTLGPTTTIQMVAPYRFSPSSVSINRCDAVKAVYADSSGAPHNWQGPHWHSPDMSSSGQSYTFRFTSSGTFNFFCSYHQSFGMTGTVTVH